MLVKSGAIDVMSYDKYGHQKIDRGWDESCMLNSELVIMQGWFRNRETGKPELWDNGVLIGAQG